MGFGLGVESGGASQASAASIANRNPTRPQHNSSCLTPCLTFLKQVILGTTGQFDKLGYTNLLAI